MNFFFLFRDYGKYFNWVLEFDISCLKITVIKQLKVTWMYINLN